MATANLRLSFGAMYIGCVISVSFSGIAALQAYLYFRQYRNRDSRRMKATVLGAWALDLVHTIFICQGIWHYLVLNWGNLDELNHITWTVASSIAVTGFITILVHFFFANRVWRLSKHNPWITGVIVVLAIIRLASALTTTSQMLRLKHFTIFITDFRWLFTFGLALSSIIDVIITFSLCYYLRSSVTGYSSIDDVIHRITLYTINNGLLTCLASLIDMVCAASMPHNFLFLSLHFIIAKCYVNSLLSTLNSRDALRDHREDTVPMAVHISVEGGSQQPRLFRRQLSTGHSVTSSKGHDRVGSNGTTAGTVNSASDNVKVHINVERTIHADDGDLVADLEAYGREKADSSSDRDSMADSERARKERDGFQ